MATLSPTVVILVVALDESQRQTIEQPGTSGDRGQLVSHIYSSRWGVAFLPPCDALVVFVRAAKGIEGVIGWELPRHVLEIVLARRLEPGRQSVET